MGIDRVSVLISGVVFVIALDVDRYRLVIIMIDQLRIIVSASRRESGVLLPCRTLIRSTGGDGLIKEYHPNMPPNLPSHPWHSLGTGFEENRWYAEELSPETRTEIGNKDIHTSLSYNRP